MRSMSANEDNVAGRIWVDDEVKTCIGACVRFCLSNWISGGPIAARAGPLLDQKAGVVLSADRFVWLPVVARRSFSRIPVGSDLMARR
jgi:hypothetical protein